MRPSGIHSHLNTLWWFAYHLGQVLVDRHVARLRSILTEEERAAYVAWIMARLDGTKGRAAPRSVALPAIHSKIMTDPIAGPLEAQIAALDAELGGGSSAENL